MTAPRDSRRRAYGTGTLRVVGGSWLASWYGPDGRRVQRKVGAVRTEGRADGLTKAQAERVLRRMREIESPRSAPDGQRMTMEEAGKEFCQRLELKGRRKSHRLTVASDLANHIAPFFAGKTLDRVRPEDIERYVAAKRRTLAIKTIRNHINTMHSIFDLGLRKGWCQLNPVKLADRPTVFAVTEERLVVELWFELRSERRRRDHVGHQREADPCWRQSIEASTAQACGRCREQAAVVVEQSVASARTPRVRADAGRSPSGRSRTESSRVRRGRRLGARSTR